MAGGVGHNTALLLVCLAILSPNGDVAITVQKPTSNASLSSNASQSPLVDHQIRTVASLRSLLKGFKLPYGVSVDSWSLTPFGKLTVKGLAVQNPTGFSGRSFLSVEKMVADLDLTSCFASSWTLQKFDVTGVDFKYQKTWQSSNVESWLNKVGGDDEDTDETYVILREVTLADVRVKTVVLGVSSPWIPLPTVHYDNFYKSKHVKKDTLVAKALLMEFVKRAGSGSSRRRKFPFPFPFR